MNTNETALSETTTTKAPPRMATPGQMKDIYGLAIQAIPTDLTFEQADQIIGDKTEFIENMAGLFPKPIRDPIKQWENFYEKVFGQTLDLSRVKIPKKRNGFDRLIIIAKRMTANMVYSACAKRFKCRRYTDDLDATVPANDRTPTEHYAIWVRDRVEADEELKGLSADDLPLSMTKGVTLLERLLHELKYFLETRKHLDLENITLCSGSRYADGFVPSASWFDGEFRIFWCNRGSRHPYLRSREAVTL